MTIEEFLASLEFRSGEIELPGGIARLDMPGRIITSPGGPPVSRTLPMVSPSTTISAAAGTPLSSRIAPFKMNIGPVRNYEYRRCS